MTTETMLPGEIQAKDGVVGKEYLWINAKGNIGARTLLSGLKDGKAKVKFWVEGSEFNTTEHTVPGTQLLKEVGQAPVQAKGAAKAPAQPGPKPAKVPKAPKVAKVRLPKKAPGEKTARVELLGFSFRKDYRSRLSPVRAAFCAAAAKESCHCRCAGSLHGKDHTPWFEAENALFEKSPNGAITALQVLALVKKFGGVVIPEAKPKGRKPLTPEQVAERDAAKAAVKAEKDAAKEAAKVAKAAAEAAKVAAKAADKAAKAAAKPLPKPAVKAPVKAQVKPQAKAPVKAPAKTALPK